MKLKLSLNKAGYIYMPKDLKDFLGVGELEALVNAKTLVIYKSGENLTTVSKSLGVIQQDIELRTTSPPVEICDVKKCNGKAIGTFTIKTKEDHLLNNKLCQEHFNILNKAGLIVS